MSILELLHGNAVLDNDLLAKNDAKGDVFAKPRDVDFAFKTEDKGRAQALCDLVNEKNFGKATINYGDGGTSWVMVVIYMPVTQHLLCSVSAFMACLGSLFQVEYDGWGSVIQND